MAKNTLGRNLKNELDALDRTLQALELRKAGLSYREISRQLGYKTESAAFKAVDRCIKKIKREATEEMIEIELERCDALLAGVWDDAVEGDVKKVKAALDVMARRARLTGMDAPDKLDVTGGIDLYTIAKKAAESRATDGNSDST